MAALRNNLHSMTQAEESEWRRPFLRQFCARKTSTGVTSKINFFGHEVCLRGFAIIAGGPFYIRSCYRDLSRLAAIGSRFDSGVFPVSDQRSGALLLRHQSHQTVALRAYLRDVVEQLAENDPVSGKLIISVSYQPLILYSV